MLHFSPVVPVCPELRAGPKTREPLSEAPATTSIAPSCAQRQSMIFGGDRSALGEYGGARRILSPGISRKHS